MATKKHKRYYLQRSIKYLFIAWYWLTRPTTHGVKSVIFHKNKVLMVRLTYYPDTWTFPGGSVDKNETPIEAVKRETQEEVGLTLRNPKHVCNLHFNHAFKNDTVSVYKETVDTYDINTNNLEIAEGKWFPLNELPIMGENTKKILASVIKNTTVF